MWRLPYFLILVYRRLMSPWLPRSCRFAPSCSEYAAVALRRHGLLRGGYLSARRLLHCHPWHPGGYDPVPDRSDTGVSGRGGFLTGDRGGPARG